MDLLQLQTDLDAANNGMWFTFGEGADAMRIKIAAWHNKKHAAAMRKLLQKYGRRMDSGAINDGQADRIMASVWHLIVLDWENLHMGTELVPYSQEKLVELKTDKRYAAFFSKIEGIAKEEENFRVSNVDDDELLAETDDDESEVAEENEYGTTSSDMGEDSPAT